MSVIQRINENKIDYVEKYEHDPEYLFVNTQTYEEILLVQNLDDPSKLFGAILISANEMQRPFVFLSEEDMQIGLKNYQIPREDVIFRKFMNTQRKPINNPNIGRIGKERIPTNIIIPYQAIESYQQRKANKDLKF